MTIKNIRSSCWVALTVCIALLTLNVFALIPSDKKEDVLQGFIDQMAKKHQFEKKELAALFKQVRKDASVLQHIATPYEAEPWYLYKHFFLTTKRAKAGLRYWRAHKRVLRHVAKKYGVPASIIVAIIGIETDYGRYMGGYRVIDALSTLAFFYPPRATFFRKELESFLLLTRQDKLNPLEIKGSYAGAIGMPQFMPSSYLAFGVDYSHTGKIDLINSHKDAIASTAYFLQAHGWETNQPIVVRTHITGKRFQKLINEKKAPHIPLLQYEKNGIQPNTHFSNHKKALFFPLQNKTKKEYWFGFNNFYVIKKYNSSTNYAMVVYQLSEMLKSAHGR